MKLDLDFELKFEFILKFKNYWDLDVIKFGPHVLKDVNIDNLFSK